MSFRAVVSSNTRSLSASESRVLNVLLSVENGGETTAAGVAEKAKTHESTVVRFAQKLGYRGYPELRSDLKRDAARAGNRPPVMRADTGFALASLVDDERRSLGRLMEFISQEDLTGAAQTLHKTKVAYVFSNHDDLPTRELMARRLRRLGITVVTLDATPKDIAERFASFDETSTLIAFALRDASIQLPSLVSEATKRGGRTILISDVPGYRFRPSPDHLLAAPRGDDMEFRTQLIPMAICYALQLAVFHLDPVHYQAVREGIDDLTRLMGGSDQIPLRP